MEKFSFTEVDVYKVYAVLNQVDKKAAAGHDGLSGQFIQNLQQP